MCNTNIHVEGQVGLRRSGKDAKTKNKEWGRGSGETRENPQKYTRQMIFETEKQTNEVDERIHHTGKSIARAIEIYFVGHQHTRYATQRGGRASREKSSDRDKKGGREEKAFATSERVEDGIKSRCRGGRQREIDTRREQQHSRLTVTHATGFNRDLGSKRIHKRQQPRDICVDIYTCIVHN